MASAEKIVVMDASVEQIFNVLKDYESYPEFMDGVTSVDILSRDGGKVQAEYSLNVIKKFSYTLNLVEEAPNKLSWSFDNGDIFKINNGSWTLKDLGDGTTEVTYAIEVEIKIKMMGSGMITKKLVQTSLPSMMKEVEKRAQSL